MDGIRQQIKLDHDIIMVVEMGGAQRIAFQGAIGNVTLSFYQTIPQTDKSGLWADKTLRLDREYKDQ